MNLGAALALVRELRGKSQAQIARQAGIGTSQLSKYETGKELPKLDSLERVLFALDIGYIEFFHTLSWVDRRAETVGENPEVDSLKAEDPSEELNGAFETTYVMLARLQRYAWERLIKGKIEDSEK